jgi:hypothetical protein
MYAQCNVDGEQYLLLKSICDHKKDGHAIEKADAYITEKNRKSLRKTTKGWLLCVEWKDGTTTWEKLTNLKESNPVEVAEYALSVGIDDEPAFKWWVPFTLNKRDRIILAVNSRYHKRTHKFGFEIPKTVQDAFQLDDQNNDDLWAKAIKKEMGKVRIAFDIKPHGEKAPVGYTQIGCHIIFDVNSFHVMAPILALLLGLLFLRGHIFLKNWSYRPLLRASTSPFNGTCLFIYSIEVPFALYRSNG